MPKKPASADLRPLKRVTKVTLHSAIFTLTTTAAVIGCFYLGKYSEELSVTFRDNLLDSKYAIANYLDLLPVEASTEPPSDKDIVRLVRYYSHKAGLNEVVGLAVLSQESRMSQYRHRYEEGWERDYGKKVPCPKDWNKSECKLLYSSIGAMQISFPIWHKFCGVNHPVELFQLDKNIECGIQILTNCLYENREESDNGRLLRICIRKYNGSGAAAERYAAKVIERLADFAISDKGLLVDAVIKDRKRKQLNG